MAGIEDLTIDEVLAELDDVFAEYAPEPGDFSLGDIELRYGFGREKARNKVEQLIKAGRVQQAGRYRGRNYYRLVK